jgi:hypothetical protein
VSDLTTLLSVARLSFVVFSFLPIYHREMMMDIGMYIRDYMLYRGGSEAINYDGL